MSSILFAVAGTEDLEDIHFVARYLGSIGHRIEVHSEEVEIERILKYEMPNILVADFGILSKESWSTILKQAEQPNICRLGVILLMPLLTELGGVLPFCWQFRSIVDVVVVKPIANYNILLCARFAYREQLVLSVGMILARLGFASFEVPLSLDPTP